MTDDLTNPEPWEDPAIPLGINAERVYRSAITIGGQRRKRRRHRYLIGSAIITVIAVTPIALAVATPKDKPSKFLQAAGPPPNKFHQDAAGLPGGSTGPPATTAAPTTLPAPTSPPLPTDVPTTTTDPLAAVRIDTNAGATLDGGSHVVRLKARAILANGQSMPVPATWSVSDPSIAPITPDGLFGPNIRSGTVTVTATYTPTDGRPAITGSSTVQVIGPPCTKTTGVSGQITSEIC